MSGIQPTDGELLPLDGSGVRDVAPRELTFRFDENQQIDTTTLAGIRILRSGFDGDFNSQTSDLNTNGNAVIQFTAQSAAGRDATILFTKSNHAQLGRPIGPTITVTGKSISIDLNTDPANATTALQLVNAINGSTPASALIRAELKKGGTTNLAAREINYSPLRLNQVITPGYIGVGEAPDQNQVIVRLAESLPDDLYRIELYGIDDALEESRR